MAKRILCIDERSDILDLVQDTLEEHGYEVVVRRSPLHDLAEIKALHPDLILLALPPFPDSPGKQTLKLLHLGRPAKFPPVVAIYDAVVGIQPQDRSLIKAEGISVIPNPFDLTSFVQSIKRALNDTPSRRKRTHDLSEPIT